MNVPVTETRRLLMTCSLLVTDFHHIETRTANPGRNAVLVCQNNRVIKLLGFKVLSSSQFFFISNKIILKYLKQMGIYPFLRKKVPLSTSV